ncbi:hypothetical protein DT304_14930 [Lactobacillus reuteri]|jgi:hypothetical protein|uniref:Uncharacterized protein n=2 Tax=Limosilactobacillus reuteri TaxID=1598 RepID=A0A2R7DQB6_LIMRT|nr:hypothetical protein HMPREF0535_1204 [Limosilactobacillus reuteri MM2-3]EGC14774.1 hypothetical protein HMPREF0536_11911 [Limosilactobacillus reuteri MM4-1A]MBC6912427.1 hypothetical protein [Limosilactobacillus reuteri]MCT3190332.1 hypothetical protein [Limosilactobacillus reuteri]MCT3197468.1 hypothetical protein [Limosilactobacillus reuteri]
MTTWLKICPIDIAPLPSVKNHNYYFITKNLFLFLLTGNIKNKDFIEGADVHRDQRQKILNNALAEAKSMAKVF